jgi:hypothetical protein
VPEVILPAGYERQQQQELGSVLIDNRTELPDGVIEGAVETYFLENASLMGANANNTFQTYASEGSLLARTKFRTPASVYDEIELCRSLAERDDDVRGVLRMMTAVAFSDGMENHHPDEQTVKLFNGLARYMNLDSVLKRIYLEYLIAQQVTTVSLFTRRQPVDVDHEGNTETMVAPVIGILPAERIRTIGSDLFGTADLAYIPEPALERWLSEFFDEQTSPARKAELRRIDPVSAVMFTGPVKLADDANEYLSLPIDAYRLNPRMVHRTKAPTSSQMPRPLLTASFALLEAKRLLNLMDFALLQGGMNFIVVAKKGDKDRPALQPEVENLKQVVRSASRTGVIVGDHRLSFEIITPDLTSLLDREKRTLLGRRIAMTMLGLPESGAGDSSSSASVTAELELIARVIASDRNDVRRHVENNVYEEAAQRNGSLSSGIPRIWFPKIILQGTQYFTDYVLKLRDRGDIPRKTAVEAAGFDWEAGVEQRKRELKDDIDETMMPAAIPFDGATGPQDNNSGRPVGGSPANGAPGSQPSRSTQDRARPLRTVNRSAGETVKAVLDEATGETRRIGERTLAILDEFPDRSIGRVSKLEREALEENAATTVGPLTFVPVNPGYDVTEIRAVRLATGLSVLVGKRIKDEAIVAKALCFRAPEFEQLDAEETALRWGFPIANWERLQTPELAPPKPELASAPEDATLTIERDSDGRIAAINSDRLRKVVHRDENGVISSVEVFTRGNTTKIEEH